MPLMKPPHYQGVSYNGTLIEQGGSIDVLPIDVEALAAEGWTTADSSSPSPIVVIESEENSDA